MKRIIHTILTSMFLSVVLLFSQNGGAQLISRQPGDTFPCPGEWMPDCNPKAREVVKQLHNIKTTILPNPTRNYFTVQVSDMENTSAEIKVFDQNGILRYEVCGSAYQTYRFGDGFMPGLYLVQINLSGKQVTIKALKW